MKVVNIGQIIGSIYTLSQTSLIVFQIALHEFANDLDFKINWWKYDKHLQMSVISNTNI